MPVDLDALREAQLLDLNRRVVERLRFLSQARAHQRMLQFGVGDQVGFDTPDERWISGTLTRYNKKTVTVPTADGQHWNVAPTLLRRVRDAGSNARR